jgi:hypothetical protein
MLPAELPAPAVPVDPAAPPALPPLPPVPVSLRGELPPQPTTTPATEETKRTAKANFRILKAPKF